MGKKEIKSGGELVDVSKGVAGIYEGSRIVKTKFGEQPMFMFTGADGQVYSFFGGADLKAKMSQVPVGASFSVSLVGAKPSNKGNDLKIYKVEIDV